MSDLRELLHEAQEIAKKMHADLDLLNMRFVRLQSEIHELHLGVSGRTLINEDGDTLEVLSWRKFEGAWQLVVDVERDGVPQSTTALVRTSRTTRIKAASVLPELVDVLIANVSLEIKQVEEATRKVEELVAKIHEAAAP